MSTSTRTFVDRFGGAASTYEAVRPVYPPQLFDDLVELAALTPGCRLLEIGCATGKATRPLLERGFSVVCVEPSAPLAEHARHNLCAHPVEIHVAPFETCNLPEASFDLVYAATAWHWLEREVRFAKAHRLLRPGGHLAFWSALHAFPAGFDPFFTEIQDAYDAIGESYEGEWPPPPPDRVADEAAEIAGSGLFEDVRVRRFVWHRHYTAEEYVALLDTFSSNLAMEDRKREHLYGEVRRRLGERVDGRVLRHWYAILHVARRKG